jgi:hypothetical protein
VAEAVYSLGLYILLVIGWFGSFTPPQVGTAACAIILCTYLGRAKLCIVLTTFCCGFTLNCVCTILRSAANLTTQSWI